MKRRFFSQTKAKADKKRAARFKGHEPFRDVARVQQQARAKAQAITQTFRSHP